MTVELEVGTTRMLHYSPVSARAVKINGAVLAVVGHKGIALPFLAVYHPEIDAWQLDGWDEMVSQSDLTYIVLLQGIE